MAQVATTILVAWIGHRIDPVKWNYGGYAAAFAVALAFGVGLSHLETSSLMLMVALKLAGLGTLAAVLGLLFWNRPLIAVHAVVSVVRRRPSELAVLFHDDRGIK